MIRWRKTFLVSSAVLLIIISIANVSSVSYPTLKAGISPVPTVMKLPVQLYFIDEHLGRLIPENRNITIHNNLQVEGVLEELKREPKNRKLTKPLDSTVKVESVEISGRVCFLNLSSDFLAEPQWLELDHKLVLDSIVNSLTELEQVQSVQFLVDGKPIYEVVDGMPVKGPMKKDDQLVYTVKSKPIEVVLQFLNSVQSERYDVAYELIDFKSRSTLTYDQFVKRMEKLTEQHQNYERKVVFTQRIGQSMVVYIRYQSTKPGTKSGMDVFSENWEVAEEDQAYKVLLKDAGK